MAGTPHSMLGAAVMDLWSIVLIVLAILLTVATVARSQQRD